MDHRFVPSPLSMSSPDQFNGNSFSTHFNRSCFSEGNAPKRKSRLQRLLQCLVQLLADSQNEDMQKNVALASQLISDILEPSQMMLCGNASIARFYSPNYVDSCGWVQRDPSPQSSERDHFNANNHPGPKLSVCRMISRPPSRLDKNPDFPGVHGIHSATSANTSGNESSTIRDQGKSPNTTTGVRKKDSATDLREDLEGHSRDPNAEAFGNGCHANCNEDVHDHTSSRHKRTRTTSDVRIDEDGDIVMVSAPRQEHEDDVDEGIDVDLEQLAKLLAKRRIGCYPLRHPFPNVEELTVPFWNRKAVKNAFAVPIIFRNQCLGVWYLKDLPEDSFMELHENIDDLKSCANALASLLGWMKICSHYEETQMNATKREIETRSRLDEMAKERKGIMEAMPGLVWICEALDGRCIFLNNWALEYTGRKLEEVLGLGWIIVVHPDDREACLQAWLQAVREKAKEWSFEYRIRHHSGVYRWFLARGYMVQFETGGYQFFGSSIEIDDYKRTMGLLKSREVEHKQILESIPAMVWTSTPDGDIDYFNSNWSIYTGRRNEEALGDGWLLSTHSDDREAALRTFKQLIETKSPGQFEHRIRMKDGNYRWFLTKAFPLLDDKCETTRFIGLCYDIDDQKLAKEEAIHHAAMKANFFSNMSHELRTPFAGVLGNLELMEDTELTPEQTNLVSTAKRSTERLLAVINDILDFSKLEAGKVALEEIEFDVEQVFEDLLELLTPLVAEKGLEFYGFAERNVPCRVVGDPTRLRQILLNLTGNAIKFTSQGHVVMSCRRLTESEIGPQFEVKREEAEMDSDDRELQKILLEFSVSDTGLGMSPDETTFLFRPFMQVDSSTTRLYGGSGLGLSIVSELVKLMGGTIDIESAKNQGSTFRFTCIARVHREHLTMDRNMSCTAETTPLLDKNKIDFSSFRILVVAKNELCIANLRALLNGYIGQEVGDTEEAWYLLEHSRPKEPFHVLFVDVASFPLSDLVALFHHIQARANVYGSLRIVICNNLLSQEFSNVQSTLLSGLNFVQISKPLWRRKLLNALTNTAQRRRATADMNARNDDKAAASTDVIDFEGKVALIAEDNPISQKLLVQQLSKLKMKVVTANNGQEAIDLYKQYGAGYFAIALFDYHMPLVDGPTAAMEIRKLESESTHGGEEPVRLGIIGLTADIQKEAHEKCREHGMDFVATKPIKQVELRQTVASLIN